MNKKQDNRTISPQVLAEIWGMSIEGAKKKASRLGFVAEVLTERRGRGGKSVRYPIAKLPTDIQRAILEHKASKDNIVTDLAQCSDSERQFAYKRFEVIKLIYDEMADMSKRWMSKNKLLDNFLDRYNQGEISQELLSETGTISKATIQRWMRRFSESGNNMASLVPAYGKRRGKIKLNDDERDYIKALLLNPQKVRVLTAYQLFVREFGMKQLSNLCYARADGSTISYQTVKRFFASIPFATKTLLRDGKEAYNNKCLPFNERDYETVSVNQCWNSDGHTFNIFAIDEATGKTVRPDVVMWQDLRSRKIMGFSIGANESTTLVVSALADAIRRNGHVKPQHILIDNGRAYKNKQTVGTTASGLLRRGNFRNLDVGELDGLYSRLGIIPHFSIPYNAKAKPIERTWGTVNNYFSRMLEFYTGINIFEKPEGLNELLKTNKDKLLTLSQLTEAFEQFIEFYNNKIHTGDAMNNRTPNEVYADGGYSGRITEIELSVAMMRRINKMLVVGRQGVKCFDRYYYHSMLEHHIKNNVIVSYDQNDLSYLYIYDKQGRFLCKATELEKAKWSFDSTAENLMQINEKNKIEKKANKMKQKYVELVGDINRMQTDVMREASKQLGAIPTEPTKDANDSKDNGLKQIGK